MSEFNDEFLARMKAHDAETGFLPPAMFAWHLRRGRPHEQWTKDNPDYLRYARLVAPNGGIAIALRSSPAVWKSAAELAREAGCQLALAIHPFKGEYWSEGGGKDPIRCWRKSDEWDREVRRIYDGLMMCRGALGKDVIKRIAIDCETWRPHALTAEDRVEHNRTITDNHNAVIYLVKDRFPDIPIEMYGMCPFERHCTCQEDTSIASRALYMPAYAKNRSFALELIHWAQGHPKFHSMSVYIALGWGLVEGRWEVTDDLTHAYNLGKLFSPGSWEMRQGAYGIHTIYDNLAFFLHKFDDYTHYLRQLVAYQLGVRGLPMGEG